MAVIGRRIRGTIEHSWKDRIGTTPLNRPYQFNAVNRQMFAGLHQVTKEVSDDEEAGAGREKSFRELSFDVRSALVLDYDTEAVP